MNGKSPAPVRPFARVVLMAALVLAVLSGCSSIPTTGPVGTASADSGGSSLVDTFAVAPRGPSQNGGETPEEILQGFITAGTGAADDYSVAREFLTDSLAYTWTPTERVLIYGADPNIVAAPDGNTYSIQLEVVGALDTRGIRTDKASGTTETVSASMEQVDGQWRISAIPNGIMISQVNFSWLFLSHNLYFYSSTFESWVPDTRWFVQKSGIAANVVKAMLEGPAPYLQGAVSSAFPAGTALARDAVPVVSGVATVDLSAEVLQDSSDLNRQQMALQLRQNLTHLNNVNSVSMTVNQREVDLGKESNALVDAVADPEVGSTQIAVYQNELAYFKGVEPQAIEGIPSVAEYGPRDPALSLDLATIAFLNGDRTSLFLTGPNQEVRKAVDGASLTAPSIDPEKWTWTASNSGAGAQILALPPGGEAEQVLSLPVPWLNEASISELRISRDGARALLITNSGGRSHVLVAGVVRDANGIPKTLTTPLELAVTTDSGSGIPETVPVNRAKWVSEDAVAVLQTSAEDQVTPVILRLGADPEPLAGLTAITGLSVGKGEQEIYAQTPSAMYKRMGNSWYEVGKGLLDPAFPG
ncbi:LpqB family beta-propeller domain-containing protein [Arthrobacter gengyunqii]|uniref:LpqB family beta-propeller domain-containing protein n=1 Tax=Arthrobacter gengyunqii TaxID=2886940 RepID=A0A9X1LZH7_9MICC|nr:LpqB family beta-propeller domain-containing protein [Arthrobacter gengyunqii]MCC3267967.1 LpqB family beta-propeller domain-containing protein [Arthrobacter gengyunqii]UOY95390.1 LpqB family beta-propeller domain-containing protein [Arthrobacter gengyunqii]